MKEPAVGPALSFLQGPGNEDFTVANADIVDHVPQSRSEGGIQVARTGLPSEAMCLVGSCKVHSLEKKSSCCLCF